MGYIFTYGFFFVQTEINLSKLKEVFVKNNILNENEALNWKDLEKYLNEYIKIRDNNSFLVAQNLGDQCLVIKFNFECVKLIDPKNPKRNGKTFERNLKEVGTFLKQLDLTLFYEILEIMGQEINEPSFLMFI